jgi:hypothetical protein
MIKALGTDAFYRMYATTVVIGVLFLSVASYVGMIPIYHAFTSLIGLVR